MTSHAGTLLREARAAKGLFQWEAAKAAGISAARLSTLENGADIVRPGDARRLGHVLGLDAGELLRAPRPPRRAPSVSPSPAALVMTFRDIPATCPCDWRMRLARRRPSGWELASITAMCLHHGSGGGR
jgi:transcriptional regulator with XRE-family HTH domain